MASEQKFDDADQSVYSSHVLYVVPKNANCDAVTTRLDGTELGENVYVQNATTLSQRPPWLRGVPTLYCRPTNTVVTGMRDILAYTTAWKNTDLKYNPTSLNAGWASSLGGSSLTDSIFAIEDDPVPSAPKPKGARAERRASMAAAANLAVEQLRSARAQQVPGGMLGGR